MIFRAVLRLVEASVYLGCTAYVWILDRVSRDRSLTVESRPVEATSPTATPRSRWRTELDVRVTSPGGEA